MVGLLGEKYQVQNQAINGEADLYIDPPFFKKYYMRLIFVDISII